MQRNSSMFFFFIFMSPFYQLFSQVDSLGTDCSNPFIAQVGGGANHANHSKSNDQWYVLNSDQTNVTLSGFPLGEELEIQTYINCSDPPVETFDIQTSNFQFFIYSHPLYILLRTKKSISYDWYINIVPEPNLAFDKPVVASSVENQIFRPENIVDGDSSTRWSSKYSDPQWIIIDLQKEVFINQIILNWETASARSYTLETQTSYGWSLIKTVTNSRGGKEILDFTGVQGSKIRLTGLTRNTQYGYSLFEIQVFGNDRGNAIPPVAKPGKDTIIYLPSNSLILDGSASYVIYPEEYPFIGYNWHQISGPSIATLVNADSAKVAVSNLIAGTYTFNLTIYSNLEYSKNVQVTVAGDSIPANIALYKPVLASSIESGYPPANVNDGNESTRWSSYFKDPQWIDIDLQDNFTINQVVLQWETASAKAYTIEISNDNVNWTIAKAVNNSSGGKETLNLTNVKGRYIRMNGSARNTKWGYSLLEFAVYGFPDTSGLPPIADPGPDREISTSANYFSVELDGTDSYDPDGAIRSFHWSQVSGPVVGAFIGENEALARFTVGYFTPGLYVINLEVTDFANMSTSKTIKINVNNATPNIALNKPSTSSSIEYGTSLVASNANDGNTATRWSSLFTDPQWISIDLQATYSIDKVILNWETAAAKSYIIEVSDDNVKWTTAKSIANSDGGIETLNLTGISGRFIRMHGISRKTKYGYSLYEFEVYGTQIKSAHFETDGGNSLDQKPVAFPNPFNNILTVDLGSQYYQSAKIYDMYAKLYVQWEIMPGEIQISKDLSSLSNGIYILKLDGNNGSTWIKIIKR